MNYQELKAKATPGPLEAGYCWIGPAGVPMRTGSPHICGDKNPEFYALLAHCFNNFDDLLRVAANCVERMKSEYPESQWVDEGIVEAEAVLNKCREVKT